MLVPDHEARDRGWSGREAVKRRGEVGATGIRLSYRARSARMLSQVSYRASWFGGSLEAARLAKVEAGSRRPRQCIGAIPRPRDAIKRWSGQLALVTRSLPTPPASALLRT